MNCEHKRIMSRNCELFCVDCGERLPDDFLTANKAVEPPRNPGDGKGTGKSTGRKRTAKTPATAD